MDQLGAWLPDIVLLGLLIWAVRWWFRSEDAPDEPPGTEEHPVMALLRTGHRKEAEEKARAGVRYPARTDHARAAALCRLAWVLVDSGRADEAAQTLRDLPAGHAPWPILAGLIARGQKRPADAARIFEEVLGASAAPDPVVAALLTATLVEAGRPVEAIAAADRYALGGRARGPLTGALFYAGHFAEALAQCDRQLDLNDADRGLAAYNAACCLARLGRPDEAVARLSRAVDENYTGAALMDNDPDLAAVRALPGYAAVRARLGAAEAWQPPAG